MADQAKGSGQCAWEGCDRPSRARGMCDTHYRRVLHREQSPGVGGVRPKDSHVYKIRTRRAHGNQPFYYSDLDKALTKAAEERSRGTLLYFASYAFERRLDR